MCPDASRILVIRTSSMGDIILTTPALAALKAHYPRAQLDYVAKERYGQLLQGHPHVDGLFLLSAEDGLFSLGRRLRRRQHDVVLDLHANLRSRILMALSPAATKLRYRKRTLRRRAMVHGRYRPEDRLHAVDLYLECLKPLGIEAPRVRPRLYLLPDDEEFAGRYLHDHKLTDRPFLVGLHPGARWPGKRWPAERFARVGRELGERRDARIVVFGGPGEENLASWVSREIGGPAHAAIDLSLRQLMALISRCHLFVTNDSGPMHLATALEVPVVAIFGPTHPMLGFWPLGDEDVILSADLSCSPCSLHGEGDCSRERLCLQRVDVEQVLRAGLEILDRCTEPDVKEEYLAC